MADQCSQLCCSVLETIIKNEGIQRGRNSAVDLLVSWSCSCSRSNGVQSTVVAVVDGSSRRYSDLAEYY